MGAGLGSLGVGVARPRRWGTIEVVWTVVLAVALALGVLLALAMAVIGTDANHDFVPRTEVGHPGSWRTVELSGFRADVPGTAERPDPNDVERVPWPVDAWTIWHSTNMAMVAEVRTPPPADAAAAFQTALGAAELWQAGHSAPVPPPTEGVIPGAKWYQGFIVDPLDQPPSPHTWRVIVAGDRTYVIEASGDVAVSKWFPRMIEHVEVNP